MIFLKLFLTFLKIGAVSFGGGYGMIPMIREETIANGWLTEGELLNFIAVAESTPGPIAVNIATFVGSSQGGILGALCATLGAVLPSFIIILIIVAVIRNLLKYAGVKAVLKSFHPAIAGMILATSVTIFLSTILGVSTVKSTVAFDWRGLIIFTVILTLGTLYKKFRKKALSPIVLILCSAVLGMALYSI